MHFYTYKKSQIQNLNQTNVPITTSKEYQKLITSKTNKNENTAANSDKWYRLQILWQVIMGPIL